MTEKVEGIVLQIIPHLQRSRIVKMYTPLGLLSFFQKTAQKKGAQNGQIFDPFSQVEMFYEKKRSTLYRIEDSSVIDWGLSIRSTMGTLFAAGAMAKALLRSQLPEKPSPKLYALFACYLKHLPLGIDPDVLTGSFLLKLLLHEGIIDLQDRCFYCGKEAQGLSNGVSACKEHLEKKEREFSPQEWQSLFVMGKAQRISHLDPCAQVPDLIGFLEKRLEQDR
ncbi:MAG: DNA repair protein RecO [Chlamydiota bacterium]